MDIYTIILDVQVDVERVDKTIDLAIQEILRILARNSLTTDKLVHTLGMKKDESIQRAIEYFKDMQA